MTNALTRSGLIRSFRLKASAITFDFPGCEHRRKERDMIEKAGKREKERKEERRNGGKERKKKKRKEEKRERGRKRGKGGEREKRKIGERKDKVERGEARKIRKREEGRRRRKRGRGGERKGKEERKGGKGKKGKRMGEERKGKGIEKRGKEGEKERRKRKKKEENEREGRGIGKGERERGKRKKKETGTGEREEERKRRKKRERGETERKKGRGRRKKKRRKEKYLVKGGKEEKGKERKEESRNEEGKRGKGRRGRKGKKKKEEEEKGKIGRGKEEGKKKGKEEKERRKRKMKFNNKDVQGLTRKKCTGDAPGDVDDAAAGGQNTKFALPASAVSLLGFGETFGSDEVFDPSAPSIFDTTPEDVAEKPLYDRFVKAVGMHAVPHLYTGNFMPPSENILTFDKSSDSETTGFASCVSSVKSSSSKTNEPLASAPSSVAFQTLSETADQQPSSTNDNSTFSCWWGNRPTICSAEVVGNSTTFCSAGLVGLDQHLFPLGNPHKNRDLGIIDSGCSRSMTGNKEKLDDFVKIVGELQNFNLFSVSQICDTKNKVLFTDKECPILSKEFQLPKNSQVVLRVPRRNNLYCFHLSDIKLIKMHCLLAKILCWSTKWHEGWLMVNFQNHEQAAKHGLVNGLPSKLFTNEHNCVACNKGKQHKASYKAITGGLASKEGPPAILATIDSTPYTITESLVRSQLQLDDEGGVEDLTIADIYLGMDNLRYPSEGKLTFFKNKFSPQWRFLVQTNSILSQYTKSGSWDQFGSQLAIAIICLTEERRFLQMILEIEPKNTKQYHAFKLTSKMFANMRLNFQGDHMPLLGTMLPPAQAAIAIVSILCRKGILRHLGNYAHKLLFKEVVGKLVKKVKLLEDKLKGRKRKFVMTDSDKEEDVEQDVDPLIKLAKAAAAASAVPTGGSHDADIPPSSYIPSDEFAGGSDVPAGATTGPSADPANKSKSPFVRKRPFQSEKEHLGTSGRR
ncbi:hypothetical protein Tco_1092352 [Tanacetum coccineum]|uniref:Uncharacterized protein n=1 Tax=Tanacetum coccineum TaxID=301880 RepID=A0ABQ5I9M4_9ASTR